MSRFSRHLPPLDTLIAFEAVVRTGSFTRAAAELSLTQSAVSKQIKLLEEHLGAPLFERRARGITLTAAGSGFNAIVEPMLDSLLANVLRLKSGHGSRNVSVICTHAVAQYWLFPRLLRFNAQHPELTVNIHASNEMDERVVGNYDFGVLYGHGRWSSLQADKLFDECIYPIVSTQRALPPADSLAALQALPLIQLDASAWNCLDWPDWFAHLGVRYKAPADAVTFNQITLVFDAVMQDHHMKFFIELPEEEIPPCPCDPERISQVLGILLDNAISYVPENGKIILSLSQTKTHFLICVKDNGPGIPDSAKTSVFRRFYRADSARNNRQHFGLGLCIAYEIISLHKGTIAVLDTPGGGSTFQISLPLA